jgi:pimeloyl-ACP methyl ester carboxylesterase
VRRAVAILAVVLAGLLALGHRSGSQPRRDAVAAARAELGIPLEARRVDVGDVALFVVTAGPESGPPVVLLHGFPEFWYAWKDVIAPLAAAGHRVIVPDQRGYGDSDKPRDVDAYRVDLLADDIAGLVRALGRERAFVVAHDWGGGVAWNLALRHPERVLELVVLDTPHPAVGRLLAREPRSKEDKDDTVSWYRTFFQIPWLPEESARWGNWFATSKMLRESAAPGAFPEEKLDLYRSAWDRDGAFGTMVNWYRAAFRHGRPPEPPDAEEVPERRVRVPTLVLLAGHDAFIPAEATRRSVELCDDGRLVELGSGSHWVLQEEPARIARLLVEAFAE